MTFTDTSTSGSPITGWRWRVDGPGGEVASSLAQNWSYDFAAEGPDTYDVFLSVFSNGEWTGDATDSFELTAPGTDDVALGYATATSTNTTDERLVVPIERARDPLGNELVAPAQVQLDVQEDGVSVTGFPKIKDWGFDLGSLTDPGGAYLFTGTLEEGGALGFDSQGPGVDKYKVVLTTQGPDSGSHAREFNNPHHIILRTRGAPVGSAIGPGSSDLLANVPSPWAAADVERYGRVSEQAPQRLRISDADSFTTDIATRQSTYPNFKGVFQLRYDYAWYGGSGIDADPNNTYLRPNEAWGPPGFPHPTFAMGDTPRSGISWADTVAYLAQPGNGSWTQNLTNQAQTRDGITDTLSLPYRIYLDVPTKTWSVRENKMDITNEDWLDMYTDACAVWRANSGVEAYLVGPVKIQWAVPLAPSSQDLFQAWLYDNVNPGWDIATDSGGSVEASWDTGNGRTFYDFTSNTVLEVLEASWEMVRLLRQKDPTSAIIYDPFPAHVAFSSSVQNAYESQYIAAYSATAQEAQDNYAERLKEMALIADDVMFPIESDIPSLIPNDYVVVSDRNEIRDLNRENRWVRYPDNPQTVI